MSSNLVPEVPCDRAIPPPDIHKIRRQVTQSFSKSPRFSAMNLIFGPDLSSAVPAVGREYVVQGEAELVDTRAYLGEDGFLGRPALVGQTGLEFDFEFLESLICNHFVTLSNF
ncbi:hypothetical protein [Burkholderia pseudomallei]|uniref:hypothetical protein n=1 Tax=Burkholderia pseudomallei TaxID=28450 RepID=UPI003AFB7D7F